MLYHPDFPQGKIFPADKHPEGWVDSPAKLVTTQPNPNEPRPLDKLPDEQLAKVYEATFGKKPHHLAKRETILAALKA